MKTKRNLIFLVRSLPTNVSGSRTFAIRAHFFEGRTGLKMQSLSHHQNSFLNKTIMSCLYEFPSDLVVSILAQWCDIESIVKTDSATCNTLERDCLMWSYQSDGFIINNDLQKYYRCIEEDIDFYDLQYCPLFDKFNVIHWIHSKQIKLSVFILTVTYYGVPVGPITTKALLNLNTNAITKLDFTVLMIRFDDRQSLLSEIVQFINSCRQLKTLSFPRMQYDNQLIVEIHPKILKQLEILELRSSEKTFKHMSTMSVLIEHCVSLVELVLDHKNASIERKSVTELMLINLIKKNKNLRNINLMWIRTTDKLFDTIFNHCKSIKKIIVYSDTTKRLLALQKIISFMYATLNSNIIYINFHGYRFGRLFDEWFEERYHFESQTVSEKVFRDLVQLSLAPVFKQINFTDRLLYMEDEFVLWCTNTVEI